MFSDHEEQRVIRNIATVYLCTEEMVMHNVNDGHKYSLGIGTALNADIIRITVYITTLQATCMK